MNRNQVDQIFWDAAQCASRAEQDAYLDRACAGDAGLRRRVEELLEARSKAESFLETPATELDATRDMPQMTERPGTVIGPYKLVELIGEGGMGAVYLAQQTEPVKRLVALKVIKAGMDSRLVLARFEAEWQALALMDHPNIAKVLDAGSTDRSAQAEREEFSHVEGEVYGGRTDCTTLAPRKAPHAEREVYGGRPYFVMELVKGVPITKFCDERKLTLRERLELFVPVCHAIQHAHQKGIIHRDIKPSNVLVALYDGCPMPKVIDFGVAKAVGQPLTEQTLVTGLGAVVGTPTYMSPEQAELNQLDIDTRSDVYSLGILLYELLTGTTPLTRKRVKESTLFEVLRAIREEEPQKPSTRLSTADGLASIAANRGTDAARLNRLVRGELDWVVMKALEKDRNRRYETADGFEMDVQRYLAGEAVQAVPPSARYRLRKFAQRNRRALLSSALLGLMLLVLVGGLGWVVSDRASRQRRTTSEVNQLLQRVDSLYADNRLPEAVAEAEKARWVLGTTGGGDEALHGRVLQRLTELQTAAKLEEILMESSEPAVRDRMYTDYARTFRDYGIDVDAISNEEAAARIAGSYIKLDLVLSLDLWASALATDPRRPDPAHWQRLFAISRAADPDPWRLRYNAASEAKDLQALREIAKEADVSRLRTRILAALGDSLRKADDVKASVAFLRKAQRRHPADYSINSSLGWSLRSLEPPQWDDAVAFRRIAVAVRPQSCIANYYLGFSLEKLGKLDEAMDYYRTVIVLDPNHAPAHFCLANVLSDRGKPEEALVHFRKASELLPNDPHPQNGLAWELATSAEPRLRDPAKAVALAKRAVDLSLEQEVDRNKLDRERLGTYWNTLGVAHYRAGDWKAAIAALNQSMKLRKGGDISDWLFMAMAQWRLDHKEEARKWYDQAVKGMEKDQSKPEERLRFRAEAAELLGIDKQKD